MCLELSKSIIIYHCLLIMVVHCQVDPSPCPNTFQYRIDPNGQLYGTIGVYSFNKKIVRLNVQLSVGNHVQGYNGRIELDNPREQVVDDVENRRAIRYRVYFPRWENIPPRVTQILVNGQEVCSGPPIDLDRWIRVVTSVTLQHTLTLTVNELRPRPSQNSFPNTNFVGNPFLPKGDGNTYGRDEGRNPFFNGNGDGFDGGKDYEVFLDVPTTTTTVRPTTQKTSQKPIVNDLLFSDNPFLNDRRSTPKTPPRSLTRPPSTTPKPVTSVPPGSSNNCGVPVVPNPLVVNGNAVPLGAFPWLVAMFATTGTGFEYKCGGSLVSNKHVVTAAHCLHQGRNKQIASDKIFLVLGKLNIQNFLPSEYEKVVGADDIRIHPDYVPLTSDADIAIIVLSEEIVFGKYIRPICLWSESDDIDDIVGQKGKVVGWGRDERNNTMTAEPKQVDLPVVSQEQCLRSSEAFKYITSSRTFCAGDRNDSGPCNGDSGSGFIMKKNGRWSLRGVVSISTYDSVKQSCDLSNYVVFTDVSKFRAWLLSIMIFI